MPNPNQVDEQLRRSCQRAAAAAARRGGGGGGGGGDGWGRGDGSGGASAASWGAEVAKAVAEKVSARRRWRALGVAVYSPPASCSDEPPYESTG